MSFFEVAVAVGIAFIIGVNVAMCVAVLRQRASCRHPRRERHRAR
jgi:hypothetical protein